MHPRLCTGNGRQDSGRRLDAADRAGCDGRCGAGNPQYSRPLRRGRRTLPILRLRRNGCWRRRRPHRAGTAGTGPGHWPDHGAGLNQPSPITALTNAAAALEWAPKVLGIVNLLDSLDLSRLKMVVGFGSIIGVTGMRGNAVYGFSNEVMANLLAGLRRRLPNAHVVSIAYSVWDEVGM